MKYWFALPPPECWTSTRPGVTRRMSCTLPMGRSWKSRSRTENDDAALIGRDASTTDVSPCCFTSGVGGSLGSTGGGGGGGGGGRWNSYENCTVERIGVVPRFAGWNTNFFTAASAASSKP